MLRKVADQTRNETHAWPVRKRKGRGGTSGTIKRHA